MNRRLSTAEAARILGMHEARIRELVRRGLGRPERRGRRYAFSFQDLVILRAAHALIEQDVPAARVARALSSLADALPEDRPLSGLRIRADGRGVVVRDEGTEWDPETGQTVLDFSVDELTERADAVRRFPANAGDTPVDGSPDTDPPHDLDDPALEDRHRARTLFNQAIDLEDHDAVAACDLYGAALELDPDLVDAYINLGRLAHDTGKAVEAVRLYNLALERTPDDPIVHFNLALVLLELEGPAAALPCYERAIELDPNFADAHYNLASLCEKLERPRDALRHYNAYRRLTQSS